ncbi:hypothetical protein RF55_9492 [Lasius niger]|uniref:Reverse transcriptase domain-containing protein n=1 Tax=Lasius niger TaxID=67767 RepID=A0A0J7KJW1_LASNI|nr:hypothetical protein RF55_9492 [Lasius niger]
MLVGVRVEIRIEKEKGKKNEEGILSVKVWLVGDLWRLVGVYVNNDMEKKLEELRDWVEEKEVGVRALVGGDFNARTGREGGRIEEEENGVEWRVVKGKGGGVERWGSGDREGGDRKSADMDERLRKGGWGGVRLRERKIYTLAYADDIAVLAEDEEGLKGMMGKLEGYLDGKGLELNTGKSKVNMVGNKLWSGGVGMEGKGENGKTARQISEMDVGVGEEDSKVYGKGGGTKEYVERESRVKGLEI